MQGLGHAFGGNNRLNIDSKLDFTVSFATDSGEEENALVRVGEEFETDENNLHVILDILTEFSLFCFLVR